MRENPSPPHPFNAGVTGGGPVVETETPEARVSPPQVYGGVGTVVVGYGEVPKLD